MSEQPALTRVVRLDSLPITKAQYTKEGYLIDTPILTSVGIFEYKNEDGSIRRELRLPEHVFAPESLASYEGKPIIITHDAGYVNKNNVEEEGIGTILSKGYRDGDDVRAKIVVHDTNELKRCGLKELSLGYSLDLVEEPGEWNGQPYDAVQTNIIINHLALVANARAGEQARLNIDGKENPTSNKGGNTTMATKKKSRRRDEDDLAVQLAEAVLEEAAADPEAAADAEGAEDPIEEQGGEGNAAQPSEDLLASIRERKDRRDSEQENGPENLDEANEVIKQQNEDIDALLDMLDKKEEGGEQKDCGESNEDEDDDENADEDESSEEGNEDDDDEDESGTSMNADSIDAIVRARTALIRIGEKYHIDGLEKASMKNAMLKVIAAASPNIRLDSESEIKGAFKVAVAALAARKDTNDQRKQIASGMRMDSHFKSESDAARDRMIKRMLKGE